MIELESSAVAVVDYGVNNIGSVLSMFRRIGVPAVAVRTAPELAGHGAIVLPGIGRFDAGVTNLRAAGLFDGIREAVLERGSYVLGVCLGMQLLGQGSEEGTLDGLRLLDADVRRMPAGLGLKIPHMGWNRTECIDAQLFDGLADPRFYYVHSYHVVCRDPVDVAAACTYGERFTAAVRRDRIMGTQFHPEKSHRFGMRVLENFARIAGRKAHA